MKDFFKLMGLLVGGAFAVLALLILIFGLAVGGRWTVLQVDRWLAPQEANVQREVFEETKSYNEGKEQELVKYKFEWERSTDPVTRRAIESAVRHSFADYDISRLDPELQNFVRNCR